MIVLKDRAKVQKLVRADNGRGGWTEVPQDLGEIWCRQYRITTTQMLEFRKLKMNVDNKFIARYNEAIDKDTLLFVNGKKYRVENVELPVDRTDFMEIYAEGEKNG